MGTKRLMKGCAHPYLTLYFRDGELRVLSTMQSSEGEMIARANTKTPS